jgi:catechol 2,3-dioxygenase-like lactoylglutathione lyase family enzyme
MTTSHITQLATVGVPVGDQDQELEFFTGTLGFEKRLDAPFGGGLRWIEVGPPGGGTTVALAPAPDGSPRGVDTGVRFSTTDAGADHAYLKGSGVDVDDEVMRWPGVPPMFSFRDPEGNTFYIVESS